MPSSGRVTWLLLCRDDHGLHAVAGGGVGECLANPVERKLRGHQTREAELRHQRERARVRGAPAERAADPDLAEVHVPEIEREPAALWIHPDELEEAVGLRQRDRLRDQLGLADRLAHDVGAATARELHHLVAQALAAAGGYHSGPTGAAPAT